MDMHPVRIYLTFSKAKGIITIHQTSILLNGETFLKRKRRVRTPFDKHMKIGLGGVIATTMGKYKRLYKGKITHIAIYLSYNIAMDVIEDQIIPIWSKQKDVKIYAIEKVL